MPVKYDYDAIIIGAGISGLVCGCYLAKAGLKTLIVEKNPKAGGYCTSFIRNGFLFDACAHGLSSLRKDARMYQILRDLKIEPSFFIKRNNPSDLIIAPEHQIKIFNDFKKTREEFIRNFPGHEKAIIKFLDLLVHSPLDEVKKLRSINFSNLLDNYLKDDKLKSIFSVLILSILGSTPDKISATVGILSLREFIFDGGYYPLNGMQGFAGTLLKKYLEYKGDIKLSSSVDHIMIQNGRAIGVSFSGNNVENKVYAKNIISACDAIQTFNRLIYKDSINSQFLKEIDSLTTSSSSFLVYLAADIDENSKEKLKSNILVMNDYNLNNLISGIQEAQNNFFIITSPTMKSGSFKQNNGVALTLATGAIYHDNRYWENQKKELSERMLSLAEKILPNLSKNIVFKTIATPVTLHRWTSNYKGASFGWESNVSQFGNPITAQKTVIDNLYLIGHWSNQSSGLTFVANCAYDVATSIARERKYL